MQLLCWYWSLKQNTEERVANSLYRKYHLKQSDNDILHCCTFALGGKCENSRQENSCIKCLTCFSFVQNKMLPFLNNVNYEVSSNDKYEVVSMIYAVPKISNAFTHYASHTLCANVQFSDIETNMHSMKTDPPIVYMVPYHKQKVFR